LIANDSYRLAAMLLVEQMAGTILVAICLISKVFWGWMLWSIARKLEKQVIILMTVLLSLSKVWMGRGVEVYRLDREWNRIIRYYW
jgi:hypothetical protein